MKSKESYIGKDGKGFRWERWKVTRATLFKIRGSGEV